MSQAPTDKTALGFSQHLKSLKNSLDWPLRQWTPLLSFSSIVPKKPYAEPGRFTSSTPSSLPLYSHQPLKKLEERLYKDYQLNQLYQTASVERIRETLTYLLQLEILLNEATPLFAEHPVSWLDVGAKNWSYVEGIYRLLQASAKTFSLTGIELDANRRYTDFYSRKDYAHTYIQNLAHTTYISGDVMQHNSEYTVVSSILPFVFPNPLLQWGLPIRYFRPQAYLSHLLRLLKPQGGALLVINQGAVEFKEQSRLFQAVLAEQPQAHHYRVLPIGELPDPFGLFKHVRYGWVCFKNPAESQDV